MAIPINSMATKHIEATISRIRRGGFNSITDYTKRLYIEHFTRELEWRRDNGRFYTGATKNFDSFELGFKGESWQSALPALQVPVPNGFIYACRFDMVEKPWATFHGEKEYGSVNREWSYFTDILLMTAAIHEYIDRNA